MPDNQLKYSKYTHCEKSCVAVSQESVDKLKKKQSSEINVLETQHNKLLSKLHNLHFKILHKQKVLKQTQQCAKKQMKYLVQSLEDDRDDISRTIINTSALKHDLFGSLSLIDPQIL